MDDFLKFLHARYEADNHAYDEVAHRFGGEAILDSHLPMLDLIDMLARDREAMDPTDPRFAGLTYTLRVLAQSYAEHCRRPWQSPGARPVESRLMATRNPGGWPSGLR
ncbi:hypothetical protein ACFQ9J_35295, partial [Streptomyces sp. NPDC056529]|uniref:hypothetical protein n=1 Tax=Streptomyces sp. NPDC056529 TaxID=3345855 RepID=UPI0036ABEACE